ncbi:response regulator [Xanthomonas citri]|uniref:response regulator n=1 Tax=Xanthomonas citri TaxID=346 RepID=UPI0002C3EA39|nr:response regulator [Xanthomonas citri]AGI06959.1 single-domain response regulator [Xanthomonas citri subsp. citri Aw12879]ARR16606.1 response regulator [Xanthomonas citri pv. citri]ARR22511.1 response regulator [Xanthomonas citri pv. citri]CEE61057.1 putative single-domain response regulator [Xanthomonas citri pv. citri]CEE77757.1 putative single-domain response regulator [Xanthomonas citri pv. citri]
MQSRQQQQILLVEDDRALQELTTMLLEERGYSVIAASNALDALQIIHDCSSLALLITDVYMPGDMSGYELVCGLRKSGNEMPAVLMSGAVTLPGPLPASAIFLSKPYTMASFIRAAEEGIAQTFIKS